jgi:hypothetical protein
MKTNNMKTNKMKALLISMSLALGASVNAAVVTITPFTTETVTNYVEASTISSTLTSAGINVNRTMAPGDIFTYTFNSPLNLTSYVSSPSAGLIDLGIGINSTSGAQISFTVDLFGQGAGDPGIVQSFTAFTPLVLNTPTFVALQANTPVNIDWANNVIAIGITFNGDTAINATFGALQANSIPAIPEPSVASLLALGTVGLVALRVRRKS